MAAKKSFLETVGRRFEGMSLPPTRICSLPKTEQGFPIPFFASWKDGKPNFRVMDGEAFVKAVEHRLCWICGQKLGRYVAFVGDLALAAQRISGEPPSHFDCASYAIRTCPYLANPDRHRDLSRPEGVFNFGVVQQAVHPGLVLIYVTRLALVAKSGASIVFRLGAPTNIEWFYEGNPAPNCKAHAAREHLRGILTEN